MPQYPLGAGQGDVLTSKATQWASVTLNRPVARTAMDGHKYFVVKKVGIKCCAAPPTGQKLYARVSTADGAVYDNSYIGNVISWQKAAAVTYQFQSLNFYFADNDGGSKMRIWLVGGGPFYFARNSSESGTITSDGGTFPGTMVGWVQYAQVALPPGGFGITRNPDNPNECTITLTPIDIKDTNATGDSTSLSGYHVQIAKNAGFTDSVRDLYISKTDYKVYGLYQGFTWYARIATRNEVSEHFKLPGGVWSSTVTLAATTYTAPTPGGSVGDPTGSAGSGDGTSSGTAGGNNGGSSSSNPPPTPVTTATAQVKALSTALNAAVAVPTGPAWAAVASALDALIVTATSRDANPDWLAALNALVAARTAARTASSTLLPADETAAKTATITALNLVATAIKGTATGSKGDTGGSIPTPVPSTTGGTPTIIYTPIPDTSDWREPFGGLLVSRATEGRATYSCYLMDRGGKRRINQFGKLASISYNRIRDDTSAAQITITDLAANKDALAALSVGRHELAIFRDAERVWEGPITLATWTRNGVSIEAKDITHYLNRTVMHNAYSNAYPGLDFVVNRIAGIIAEELARKEALDPPANVLPWVHTYVQDGDARTTRVTDAGSMTVWQHLDDLAAKAGIDYVVVGRSLHIWDTSRAALGRTRVVTQEDFIGDTSITAYGMELATASWVTDGQGHAGFAGGIDPYYGEVELVATAYDENGNSVKDDLTSSTTADDHLANVTQAQLDSQALRNLAGRNPVPYAIHVPDGSAFKLGALGLDVLIPGVYVPVQATLGSRTLNQMLKLKEVKVGVDNSGKETATISLTPASESDLTNAETGIASV